MAGRASRRAERSPRPLKLEFPGELPISSRRAEIREALERHRVLVVCGATGSGKTTQLPKICLDAGRGRERMIGHTQPRRIAARAVAVRLAEELGASLGEAVGFQVRFTDRTAPETLVKVMTDGILLNEIRTDPRLEAYDTLIIDEAHERGLNIDFLLGYLKRLLERRDDLKVIVTSATIDPGRFAAHFGDAPVIEIEGRSYPVAIEYRPLECSDDLADAVVAACNEVAGIDVGALGGGAFRDVLVFLPGERWIHDCVRALQRKGPRGYEILPLYARLAARQQDRIFNPGSAPRIVLATNVAETSLTVPRIRCVVDSGLARVGRYAARHRVQSLAVEPVSRASAVQRAGRCGRLAAGFCLRLYAEEDFLARSEFTDPEILRTNLAGVILRLEALGLGHIDDFPFIDRPPAKAVNDAYRLLHVLGAIDANGALTRDGELMGKLPLDARLSRLLLAGRERRCLDDTLILAAALSVADPREYPPDRTGAARERHATFADPRSDFTTLLNVWAAYKRERGQGEKRLRAWARENFLAVARLKEWDDVHGQLRELAAAFDLRAKSRRKDSRALHQALVAAFVDFVAEKSDAGRYRGMHEARASLFPGSAVAAKPPRWVVAAEHVATDRAYLRTVAQINPRWVARAAPHLVKREHDEPLWDRRRGRVTARETMSIFGLVLERGRRVDYGAIDPRAARRIFVEEALARDDLGLELDVLVHNRRVKAKLLEWEARTRARDLYIGERGAAAFYAERLPADVRDRASLAAWAAEPDNAARLRMSVADLATRGLDSIDAEAFPDSVRIAGQDWPLHYRYEPGDSRDGVTLRLPDLLVDAVSPETLDWIVPGRLTEHVLALLRGLPKDRRRRLVPLPDTVAALLPALRARAGRYDLATALREVLAQTRDLLLPEEAFAANALPEHLRPRLELVDERGIVVASGRDLAALQRAHGRGPAGIAAEASAADEWSRRNIGGWDFGDLPERARVARYGGELELCPALVDVSGRVDLTLLPPGPAAGAVHRLGVRRLLLKRLPQQAALVRDRVRRDEKLLLSFHGIGRADSLGDDLLCAAADETFPGAGAIRSAAAFQAALDAGRADLVGCAERLLGLLREIGGGYRAVRGRLERVSARVDPAARADLETQLAALVYPGFFGATGVEWRRHLPRYLKAMLVRLDKLEQRHPKEAEHRAQIAAAWRRFADWRAAVAAGTPLSAELERYRWMVEELRVSLFAQALGTSVPVSVKRLAEAWALARAPGDEN